ncbi:MAG: ABC transporter permease, partial [Terriglobales bacterium]
MLALAAAIGLGLGGAIGIFNAAYSLAHPRLPFYQPDRLVVADYPASAFVTSRQDWKPHPESPHVFVDSAEYRLKTDFLEVGSSTRPVMIACATPQFFSVLGVRMALGQGLEHTSAPRPDRQIAWMPIVISYDVWQQELASDPNILGREVHLQRMYPYVFQVIGVAPPGFRFPAGVDGWVPEHVFAPSLIQTAAPPDTFGVSVARLRPGVSLREAEAAIHAWGRGYRHWVWRDGAARLQSMREWLGGAYFPLGALLWGIIFLFFPLVVATGASLGRHDLSGRQAEFTIKHSLGATAGRLLRTLALELAGGLALAAALGAGVGIGLMRWATRQLGIAPAWGRGPAWMDLALAAASLGAIATLVLVPQAGALGLQPKRPPQTLEPVGRRGRMAGLRPQVAIATATLIVAAALLQSAHRLATIDPGVEPRGTYISVVYLPYPEGKLTVHPSDYALSVDAFTHVYNARVREFERLMGIQYARILDRVRASPGVRSAGVISSPPYSGYPWQGYSVMVASTPSRADLHNTLSPHLVSITPGTLPTLGTRLVYGSYFSNRADANRNTVIVNESFARQIGPGATCLGTYVAAPEDEDPLSRIIGVVADVHEQDLLDLPVPTVYYPFSNFGRMDAAVVVHATGSPSVRAIRSLVEASARAVVPGATVASARSLSEMVSAAAAPTRFAAFLLLAMALTGIF